eukprot:365654-Chlamydomonas_euryale.AAC.2
MSGHGVAASPAAISDAITPAVIEASVWAACDREAGARGPEMLSCCCWGRGAGRSSMGRGGPGLLLCCCVGGSSEICDGHGTCRRLRLLVSAPV